MEQYNAMELMVCIAARMLENGSTVAVGTGRPCAAAMLAQKTHSPDLVIVFEAGGLAPLLSSMPISVGDSRTFHKALMATSMSDVIEFCQRGMVDFAFLGGARIDRYGNLNSTVIGGYNKPKVRLPGSGGANDFSSYCWRSIIMTPHDRRRFVEKVDFLTTPGYLNGPGSREAAGLPADTGPYKVITNLAVLEFDEESKRMCVESLHPGVTLRDVEDNTGFELLVPKEIQESAPPNDEELRILRKEVNPYRYVIGK